MAFPSGDHLCGSIPLDAIHYHVRSEGQVVKKAVSIAISLPIRMT